MTRRSVVALFLVASALVVGGAIQLLLAMIGALPSGVLISGGVCAAVGIIGALVAGVLAASS